MKPIRNIISHICAAFLLCIYGFSLFPSYVLHHHESHCQKDNISLEKNICHQAIYHLSSAQSCQHPTHIVDVTAACKLCKLYFSTPFEIYTFSWETCKVKYPFYYYDVYLFQSFDFLNLLTNKGPPLL